MIDEEKYIRETDIEATVIPKTDIQSLEDLIGSKVYLRTVTYHILGRVVGVFNNTLRLEKASWIADSGRFMQAIKEGKLDEVEPVGDWNVNYETVTDWGIWTHNLPVTQS